MNSKLQQQWQRLIFPPDEASMTVGEQQKDGSYPDFPFTPSWDSHMSGRTTYAPDLAWKDEIGDTYCKAAVLDVDEGASSLVKVDALLSLCKSLGISALPAWSGSKGCHLWLFFEPTPVDVVKDVLVKLRQAVPFKGEHIPGQNQRAKLPPALHQVSQTWAFWMDTLPDTAPSLKTPPQDFILTQATILEKVNQTPRRILEKYVEIPSVKPKNSIEDMEPDLKFLQNTLPSCISKLLEKGAQSELGTWDKNALSLHRYCFSADIPPDEAIKLLERFSENTDSAFQTSKDWNGKLRHWKSIHSSGVFSCVSILAAKRTLGFDCRNCAARPSGVMVKEDFSDTTLASDNVSLYLEPALADNLLQLALQTGQHLERINPAIFLSVKLQDTDPNTGNPIQVALHSLVLKALLGGCKNSPSILTWLERQPNPPNSHVKNELAALISRLSNLPPINDNEAKDLIDRATDLSSRRVLLSALSSVTAATKNKKPLVEVLGDLQKSTLRLQQSEGASWSSPLTAYAKELLENLVQEIRPCVSTPFDTLNQLLGGGLKTEKMYVLASPPGGGKSTISSQIADYAASLGIPVCYCALEMGKYQLFDYALSRYSGLNSSRIEDGSFRNSDKTQIIIADTAKFYLEKIAPYLTIIEGGWDTTAATLGAWIAQARVRYKISEKDPVLVVVDYLQLLNTGDPKLDSGQNEVGKVTTIAVQLKQLARDSGAAVLALSDIIKSEQNAALKSGSEFTLNMLRGSNRIAHAADVVLALYSESATVDGGKAAIDPWNMLLEKVKNNPKSSQFKREMDDLSHAYPMGGKSSAVHSRLELLKNRGGRGRGSQILLYERAYHRFKGFSVKGQDEVEGRG